ncbi:MAG: ferredoxin family protein [Candidatus Hydrogenedentota bacterium]
MTNEKYLCFNLSWCKRCRLCAYICPKNVIDFDEKGFPYAARLNDCIQCGQCVTYCPDFAIIGVKEEKEKLILNRYIDENTNIREVEINA